jgi:hypothetical protein
MITQDNVKVYVAAKKSSAPMLPLREALITVAVECVYEPKQKELESSSKRKRIFIGDFLRRRRITKQVQACTMYSHNEQTAGLTTLADYIENQNEGTRKKGEMTIGNSTLSSLTMTKVLQSENVVSKTKQTPLQKDTTRVQKKKLESLTTDFLEESFMPIDAPSLASTDSDGDMDDMTMNTYALIGNRDIPRMPSKVIIIDADNTSGKWWYEKKSRLSPLFFEDPKDAENFGETNMMKYHPKKPEKEMHEKKKQEKKKPDKTEEYTMVDSIMHKEIDAQSDCMEDMSTIVNSTCMLFCPNGEVFSPDDHDLKFKLELDEDLKSLDRRQQENYNDDRHWDTNNSKDFFDFLNNEEGTEMIQRSIDQQDRLFSLLADPSTKPETVKTLLDEQPQALKATRATDGRLPLHILCDHELPTEKLLSTENEKADDVLTWCIQAITNHRMFLKLVAWSHVEACSKHDKKGNLPCHLLGHRIISWTSLLQKFMLRNNLNLFELERVMMLSNIITECIDIVLRPVATQRNACKSTGSIGDMLPLHISILFGGSIDVFRSLLETYPEGADTLFVLDGCRPTPPIALLNKIKIDQKQFHELLCNGGSLLKGSLEWRTTIPGSFYEEDMIRRLDLLFCFNPTQAEITSERIGRLEAMIKSEAKREQGNWSDRLSPATEAAWIWMCSRYKNLEEREICDESIDRILRNLQPLHIKRLASVTTEGGEKLGFARPRVRKRVLEAASGQYTENSNEGSPSSGKRLASNNKSTQSKMASICKSIFAIQEDSIPVHFVVFPFPIEPSSDSKGMLVAESNARLAVEFSNFMLHETSPEMILQSIGKKMQSQDNLLLTRRHGKESENKHRLLSKIYRKGAWLYFIDGHTGTPIVGSGDKDKYPILISNAPNQVAILLPLMRMGMILMRKSQNTKILSQVLLQSMKQNCIPKPIASWPGAAQGVIECLTESQKNQGSMLNRQTKNMCEELSTFVSWHAQEDDRDDSEHLACIDWSLEITLLQLLLESTGLSASNIEDEVGIVRRKAVGSDKVVWTADRPRSGTGLMGKKSLSQNLTKVVDILENGNDRDSSFHNLSSEGKKSTSTSTLKKIGNATGTRTSMLREQVSLVDKMDRKMSAINEFLNSKDEEDCQWERDGVED